MKKKIKFKVPTKEQKLEMTLRIGKELDIDPFTTPAWKELYECRTFKISEKKIMKTIEQHLQDLFVGKLVKLSFCNLAGLTETTSGIVSDIEIGRNEFVSDYYLFRFQNSDAPIYIQPEVDTIEILE